MSTKAEIIVNKPPTIIQFQTKPTVTLGLDIVTSGSAISPKQIADLIRQLNPPPIVVYAETDLTQYVIPNAIIANALVFADGRLLANCQISNDTIFFNETVFQNQQLFIQYALTL